MGSPFPGPTPLYNNPPINPQYFQPRMYFIQNITRGQNTLVVTTEDHDYVIGQEVRLLIPPTCGIRQLNEQTGLVILIPAANEVLLNIDSSAFDAFNSTPARTQPQIVATGDQNSGVQNQTVSNQGTYIPGSFINISPL